MSPGDLLRRARAGIAASLGLHRAARARLDGSCAAILFYHRVIGDEQARRDCVEPGMYVTPEAFREQLDALVRHFRVMPLSEICARLEEGRPLPARAAAITFDDGWRDNYDTALPALAERGLPACVFVVPGRVGSEGAFWPDEVARRLEPLPPAERSARAGELGAPGAPVGRDPVGALVEHLKRVDEGDRERALDALRQATPDPEPRERELMTWEEIDALAAADIEIESHTESHAILPGLPSECAARELGRSLEALRERGHARHGLLAYPCGAVDGDTPRLARQAGYRAAFTIERGLARQGGDPLLVPRLGIHRGISGSRLEFLHKVPGAA